MHPLTKWRNKHGLSQIAFSDMLKADGFDISPKTVCNYESGVNEPHVSLALHIARITKSEVSSKCWERYLIKNIAR